MRPEDQGFIRMGIRLEALFAFFELYSFFRK